MLCNVGYPIENSPVFVCSRPTMDLYTLKTHFPPFLAEYFHFEISRRTKKAKIFQPPTFRRKVDEKVAGCGVPNRTTGSLRNSGRSVSRSRDSSMARQASRSQGSYQPPSPSEICRDVPARRSISVGWSWLPPGCCPLNSTANRMGGANSTIGGLSICTTS